MKRTLTKLFLLTYLLCFFSHLNHAANFTSTSSFAEVRELYTHYVLGKDFSFKFDTNVVEWMIDLFETDEKTKVAFKTEHFPGRGPNEELVFRVIVPFKRAELTKEWPRGSVHVYRIGVRVPEYKHFESYEVSSFRSGVHYRPTLYKGNWELQKLLAVIKRDLNVKKSWRFTTVVHTRAKAEPSVTDIRYNSQEPEFLVPLSENDYLREELANLNAEITKTENAVKAIPENTKKLKDKIATLNLRTKELVDSIDSNDLTLTETQEAIHALLRKSEDDFRDMENKVGYSIRLLSKRSQEELDNLKVMKVVLETQFDSLRDPTKPTFREMIVEGLKEGMKQKK